MQSLAQPHGSTAYLAGVGGCGMRGIAGFLLAKGWQVFGADRTPLNTDDPLILLGLESLAEGEVPPSCSLAIRSAAVPKMEKGFQAAVKLGAKPLLYAEFLGEISRQRPVLAVAGSHGKTTCTAWIAWGLRQAEIPVGYLIGAEVPQLGGSSDWGEESFPLVMESCEYARSFHFLNPAKVALINVDAEHPDTYPGGYPEVLQAFEEFLGKTIADGVIWSGLEAPPLAPSAPQARWISAQEIPASWRPGLAGEHNRRNAALVAEVLGGFGLTESQVKFAIENFRGASRRLEVVSGAEQAAGPLVVSDYAHHPVEVAATLQAAREKWPNRRLVTVFQPHQAQRFHAYRNQFAPSLDEADALLLLEIYRARDPQELKASIAELVPELRQRHPKKPLALVPDFDAGRQQLAAWCLPNDLILCLGAGTVDQFARSLCGHLTPAGE